MHIDVVKDFSVDVCEADLDVINEWLELTGMNDQFGGESYRAAFALGIHLGRIYQAPQIKRNNLDRESNDRFGSC